MGLVQTARQIWRDYVTDGVPSSGIWKPKKSEIRIWGDWIESIITAFTGNGGLIYPTKALLDADLARAANTMAWVVADPVPANNGIYGKVGASGSGSWVRRVDLPFSFIIGSDVGAGTPNALQVTTSIPVSGSALVWTNVFEANNASPVTISFNGGAPLTIKTNSGNDPVPGGLAAGMILLGIVSGTTFRLVSDQASAAILAQMEQLLTSAVDELTTATEDLRDQAAASASASAASATEAESYALMVGAAVYDFSFDSDPSTPGYDWSNS